MARYMLLGFISEDITPATTLARLNDAIAAYNLEAKFITLVYLLVDTTSHKAWLASAGHEPVIHLEAATGKVAHLWSTGRALGIQAGGGYDTHELRMQPGDIIYIYTDGLSEAGIPAHPLGEDGIADVIVRHAADPPSRIVRAVDRAALDRAEGRLRDDATSLLVKRRQ